MRILLIGLLLLNFVGISAQNKSFDNSQKVILITLDGFRWQELFGGVDSLLMENDKYTSGKEEIKDRFWRPTKKESRKALMPFVWNTVSEIGQIHGNRDLDSKVDLTNKHWFSYPGYNEILSGIADDDRIDSNSKVPNPNKTVLELANEDERYTGKVAAFGSWDVFPFIVNEDRSGVPVNAGFDLAEETNLTEKEKYLNKLQQVTPSPWSTVRLDVFTHHYALEHLKKEHPKLLYIAYGETDDFAHNGDYDAYLKSANVTDSFIKELWDFVENDPYYKEQTTFIITTDHGRGTEPIDTWRSHGASVDGADEVWIIAFGKGIEPKGEIQTNFQHYSNQIAASVAKLLGIDFSQGGKSLDFVIRE